VLIRKPASPGHENRQGVVLQAHLDMVHQKNEATAFDFETRGIEMFIDGDWVRARGTTLGADNGLGVAAIMAVLEARDLEHPPLEALFTVDEETGMSGAKALSPDWLRGRILLNLDTEDDDELGVGCAGGVDVTGTGTYRPEALPGGWEAVRLRVNGLQGGHSGMDIHKGLANANKLLARLLYACAGQARFRVARASGGNLRNAIPREAEALLALDPATRETFSRVFKTEQSAILEEFAPVEPGIRISLEAAERPTTGMPEAEQLSLLRCLCALPSGVAFMSYAFPGQTETSNNLALFRVADGQVHIGCLTRSSRESRKEDLVRTLESVLSLAGYTMETGGAYPGWQPNADSGALALLRERYQALFGHTPHVVAGHGGLECGIIGAHYPDMDMISFGPTILGAHSPDERASVASCQKFWKLLRDVLAHIPTS
jgi:dipeptidase D